MTLLDFAEAGARGASLVICLVLMTQLLVIRPRHVASVMGALFLGAAGIYAIIATPVMMDTLGPALVPLKAYAVTAPAFFWLFVLAILDDCFRWRASMVLAPFTLAFLMLICLPFAAFEPISRVLHLVITLAMIAHLMIRVRAALATDLVASRLQFSRTLAVMVPIIAAAIVIIIVLETMRIELEATVRAGIAFMILAVCITLALTLSRLRLSLVERPAGREPEPASDMSAVDRIDLGRLRDLMEDGAYLTDGLTIGGLASRMGLPEHRLRKLINQGLGYRNFAAFLNDHRIREAQRQLSDPARVHTQITQIAYQLGYGSLAPFNRAFRERVGTSPSAYRTQALDEKQDSS
ncbi:MAG: helix-turn-helix transcriptional regulator [Roseitalea sp.]|jgi:AraC-like DNA-binding protein|nr:helix-turn-helix transcriptional regulator [Roseitalea sp.]MBO6721711.1 helix-turn-helix transcriptional regulator [Roseitalea sp.]MBO6743500.1 helix-turn-helix transcriptional regulator [Roseitalea sp.]